LQAASSAIATMRMEMVIGGWADWVEYGSQATNGSAVRPTTEASGKIPLTASKSLRVPLIAQLV
jgi:hypothetical protein